MVLFSFQLLLLLTVASSTRITVEEEHKTTPDSPDSEPLPKFGEKCYEHDETVTTPTTQRAWCADGLVCSKSTWTCKVAIMKPCNKTFSQVVGVSDCAGTGTYGRSTTCGKTNPHGQSFCCIKGMLPVIPMDHQLGRRALFTSHARVNRDGIYPSDRRSFADFPECCSGKGERVFDRSVSFRVPTVDRAWMCL